MLGPGPRDVLPGVGRGAMSLGTVPIITLIIFLLGALPGRFGGCGYDMNRSGMGLRGMILIVPAILLPLRNFQAS